MYYVQNVSLGEKMWTEVSVREGGWKVVPKASLWKRVGRLEGLEGLKIGRFEYAKGDGAVVREVSSYVHPTSFTCASCAYFVSVEANEQ